jgi:tetratricopeptide (TPR) repeat protein
MSALAELTPSTQEGAIAPRSESARRSFWIISPFWDLALLVGSPLAIVPLFLWLGERYSTPEKISLAVLAFASAGHHLPGFLRAYGERELFRRFKWRFLLAPPAAIAVSLAFAMSDLHGLALVMLFWATWHGLMQTYGFMRIYDAKQGARDAVTARLDLAICLSIFAGGIAFSEARVANVAEAFWLAGGPPFGASIVTAGRWAMGAVIAVVVLLYMINVVRRDRSLLGASGAKLALAASTGWLYWLGGALSTNILIGVAMFEVFHALQYFAIVWVHNCRLAKRLGQNAGWAGMLFRNRASFLALYVGVIAAWGAPHFFGGGVLSEQALVILSAVYTASAILHFYFDGFIWKVREAELQANLGVEGRTSSALSAGRVRNLHFAKCAVLAALLGVLAMGELRSGARAADEAIVVKQLTAIAGELPEVRLRVSRLALERGDIDEALASAGAAAKERPRSHETQYVLGRALLANEMPREAAKAFAAACRLAPDQWQNHFRLGDAKMAMGDKLGAKKAYRRATKLRDAPAEAWAAFGAAQQILGEDEAAIGSFEKASELDRSNAVYHLRLAELRRERGEHREAAASYERALKLQPDHFAAWNNLGAMRYTLGDVKGAAEAWREAVKVNPRDGSAHYNLGHALLELGDEEEAAAELYAAEKLGFGGNER